MVPPRRRSHSMLTLAATDDFWQVPALEPENLPPIKPPSEIDGDDDSVAATVDVVEVAAVDADEGDCFEVVSLPPAHRQLLSSEPSSAEYLKGHDHNTSNVACDRYDDKSSYFYDDDEACDGDGKLKLGCFSRRRGSSSARRGSSGGSWPMGVVSLDDSVAPEREGTPPGLLDFPGALSLDPDECSSSSSSDDGSLPSSDGGRSQAPEPVEDRPARRGVSFNPSVAVRPIPHASALSRAQRRRMYSTTLEVRRNKARNKKEFRHDGYDWRNATEEWEMAVDMVTGELVHPAHDAC